MSENTSPLPEPKLALPQLPDPLQPLPDETPEAFEAFMLHLDSGQKLTPPKIAEILGVHPHTVYNWSSKFQWRNRILRHRAQLLSYKLKAEAAMREQEALSQTEVARAAREHKLRTFRKLDAVADTLLDNYMVEGVGKTRLGEITQLYSLSNRICNTFEPKNTKSSGMTDAQLKASEDRFFAEVAKVYGAATEPPAEPTQEEPPKTS